MARQSHGVRVFLDRGLGDLLGRLMQSGVDHLEAGIAKGPRHDLRAAVVAVEPGLGNDDAEPLVGHRAESNERSGCNPG